MKHRPFILLLLWLTGAFALSAQDTSAADGTTIFDALQSSGTGKGDVVIHQSDAIRKLVGARRYGANVERNNGDAFLVLDGYRTQVFIGNNQRTSKDEALKKEKEVKELFPDLPTYVTYTAPFWKLRVGDFRTHEEAYHLLRELTNAFPSYGKEMNIVREKIQIPLY